MRGLAPMLAGIALLHAALYWALGFRPDDLRRSAK